MPPEVTRNDGFRIRHIIEAARQAFEFSAGRCRDNLDRVKIFLRAVVHCIREVVEAAGRIALQARQAIPAVQWQQLIGMRNHLVYIYHLIRAGMVWGVISDDLKPVIAARLIVTPDDETP